MNFKNKYFSILFKTALAVSDGLTMTAYLPFALRFYCLYGVKPSSSRNSLPAIRFMLFYACFSVVVHSVSIWLTVTLAVFRYVFIRYPRYGTVYCTLPRAKVATFLVYVVTLIICIPNFITITISRPNDTKQTWYVQFKTKTTADKFINSLNFWIQAVIVKLIPCLGLTVLSILLVKTMKKADEKRKTLVQQSSNNRTQKTNRTTRMLLTVVVLFVVTELPQGILMLLNGSLPGFREEIYEPLGDLIDIMALINNGINFVIYCAMSKQFRDAFIQTFSRDTRVDKTEFTLVPTHSKAEN